MDFKCKYCNWGYCEYGKSLSEQEADGDLFPCNGSVEEQRGCGVYFEFSVEKGKAKDLYIIDK